MSKRSRPLRDKRPAGGFLALPHVCINGAQWATLSADAVKLLIDMPADYPRQRNGDLCAAWRTMSARGWRSKRRLTAALRELESRDWLARTRGEARFGRKRFEHPNRGVLCEVRPPCKGEATKKPRRAGVAHAMGMGRGE